MVCQVYKTLEKHTPTAALAYCYSLWQQTPFDLRITKSRQTMVGDFTCQPFSKPRISLNNDLSPYAFLITFVHEVAHLRVYLHFGNTVDPHGKEWKKVFQNIMQPLLQENAFPEKILHSLQRHMINPKASSYSDPHLTMALREFELGGQILPTVSSLPEGAIFRLHGRLFKKGLKRRTRVVCKELKTKKQYLVPAEAVVNEVQLSIY